MAKFRIYEESMAVPEEFYLKLIPSLMEPSGIDLILTDHAGKKTFAGLVATFIERNGKLSMKRAYGVNERLVNIHNNVVEEMK